MRKTNLLHAPPTANNESLYTPNLIANIANVPLHAGTAAAATVST